MSVLGVNFGSEDRRDFYCEALRQRFPGRDLDVRGVEVLRDISAGVAGECEMVVMSGLADNLVSEDNRLNLGNANVSKALLAMVDFVQRADFENLPQHYLNCFSMQAFSVAMLVVNLAKKSGVDLSDEREVMAYLECLDNQNILPIVHLDRPQIGLTDEVEFTDAGTEYVNPNVKHWVALHMQGILLEKMQAVFNEDPKLELLAKRRLLVGGMEKDFVYGLRYGRVLALQPHLDYGVETIRAAVQNAVKGGHLSADTIVGDLKDPFHLLGGTFG